MEPPGVLVWIDMEMTGLDPVVDAILEIASLVTDNDLNIIAEGPVLAVHQNEEILARMDDWNVEHHTESGLVERVRRSAVSVTEAQALTLAFVQRHAEKHSAPLCGNTVWQDRRFLKAYMPTLEDWLHYRIVDVSTVKELARRWKPELVDRFRKRNTHRALDDIRESVAELKHYRDAFFAL
ncbi:MAG: oligoribonuclease [Gammaproteobacteria bacterium]|nr:oligoribonuclease [Gammaproteobacteria bacterium]MDE0443485.1 oligoribonuclease [Gammaproteobacteria bacterium]